MCFLTGSSIHKFWCAEAHQVAVQNACAVRTGRILQQSFRSFVTVSIFLVQNSGGNDLVRKCHGCPLAVRLAAGMLRSEAERHAPEYGMEVTEYLRKNPSPWQEVAVAFTSQLSLASSPLDYEKAVADVYRCTIVTCLERVSDDADLQLRIVHMLRSLHTFPAARAVPVDAVVAVFGSVTDRNRRTCNPLQALPVLWRMITKSNKETSKGCNLKKRDALGHLWRRGIVEMTSVRTFSHMNGTVSAAFWFRGSQHSLW
jgi:hypothetical protein